MLDKVKNIIKINFTDIAGGVKRPSQKTPDVNSIVRLEVIRQERQAHKILINGRLFVTKLPLKAEKGDLFLARVLKSDPFELQLNNIANIELNNSLISRLLALLNINESTVSVKLLRALLKSGKIIKQSKFKKLLTLIESSEIDFGDNAYLMFAQLFWNDENLDDLNNHTMNYFRTSITALADKIYEMVFTKDLKFDNAGISSLKDILVYDLNHDEKQTMIQSYSKNKTKALIKWVKNNKAIADVNIKALRALIATFLFQKKFYNRISLNPDFMVVKINNDYRLVNLSVNSAAEPGEENILRFTCNFNTDLFGKMKWNGTLFKKQLNLLFNGKEKSFREIISNKNELFQLIKDNHGLSTKLIYAESSVRNSDFTISKKSLNATA